MRSVGIRELKNRLSEYLRAVRRGEEVLVTDRGKVVAELRPPGYAATTGPHPGLVELAHQGRARLGAPNDPEAYPRLEPVLRTGASAELLGAERGEQ
jgi:antitoxin (DNA-binding transcriptional repressor) of toxin-antitoxin stability system